MVKVFVVPVLSFRKRLEATLRRIAICLFIPAMLSSLSFSTSASTSASSPSSTAESQPQSQKMLRDGVAIEFRVTPAEQQDAVMEGKYADVEFRISDAQSGKPIKGIYPAVWLDMAKPWNQPDAKGVISCKERVQLYMQGIVGVRPLVDLNSYYVLVMNQDATISVIDPIIGVGSITKLYASITLAAPGADWAKTKDEKFMFVSMPTKDKVALVDLNTFKVISNIEAGNNPVRLAMQPDEKYLWVGNNHRDADESGVSVVDLASQEKVKFIPTGKGHHELTFSHDSRFAYVSNRDSGTVVVIDIASLEKVKTIPIGKQIIGIGYSEKSESLYVSDGEAGSISVIDANTQTLKKQIKVKTGVGPMGVSQEGRWLIAVNSFEDEVYAIDVATNELIHTIPVGRKPYQVSFSRAFVYIRSLGTERVSMIEINHLNNEKKVPVSSFQAGSNAPDKVRDLSLSSAIHEAPGEAAVLVVSPADNTVYYYMEGMNAPMGNFRNYGHRPRAVQVADRTLREDQDGIYRAKVKIPAAGTYDVAFLMESPSILHCFTMNADPDPSLKRQNVASVEFVDNKQKVNVGDDVKIRFKLIDPETGKYKSDLKDVRVRYYRAPAFDRREEPANEVDEGVYELAAKLSNAGVYYFFVSSKSSKLDFDDAQFISLRVTKPANKKN